MEALRIAGYGETPVIDAHAHIGGYGRQRIPEGGSADMLVKMMDRMKVSAAFASHMAGLTGEAQTGNRLVAEACAAHPGRIYGYLVYNPNDPKEEALRSVEQYVDAPGVAGLKFHSTLHDAHPDDARYEPAYELAARYGLPILMHTWGIEDISAVDSVCAKHPELKIIAAHAGGSMWSELSSACEAAARRENLYLDVCLSLVREGQVEYMVKKCTAGKVLFGSDASFFCPLPLYGMVLFAKITKEEKRRIFYENALEIFGGRMNGKRGGRL